jgi:hypothetical protein
MGPADLHRQTGCCDLPRSMVSASSRRRDRVDRRALGAGPRLGRLVVDAEVDEVAARDHELAVVADLDTDAGDEGVLDAKLAIAAQESRTYISLSGPVASNDVRRTFSTPTRRWFGWM